MSPALPAAHLLSLWSISGLRLFPAGHLGKASLWGCCSPGKCCFLLWLPCRLHWNVPLCFGHCINFGIQEPEWNWSCPKFRKGFTTNGLGFWTTSTKWSHSFHIWRAVFRGLIIKCYLWVSPCKEISGHFFSTLFFVFNFVVWNIVSNELISALHSERN